MALAAGAGALLPGAGRTCAPRGAMASKAADKANPTDEVQQEARFMREKWAMSGLTGGGLDLAQFLHFQQTILLHPHLENVALTALNVDLTLRGHQNRNEAHDLSNLD